MVQGIIVVKGEVRSHGASSYQNVEGFVGHCKGLAFILSKIGNHWMVWSRDETYH